MNYKLAKKLKESGFPNSDGWIDNGEKMWVDHGEIVYEVPTLSSLIEACGDGFSSLIRYSDRFVVNSSDAKIKPIISKIPEESVAKLWIKLNKLITKVQD